MRRYPSARWFGSMLLLLASACAEGARAPTNTPPRKAAALEWVTLEPAPTPRTEVAGAAAGNLIYVMGGFAEPGDTVATVEVYDTATDSWVPGPELPIPLNHAMATTLKGRVYVIGGYRGPGLQDPSARVFKLGPDGWKDLPALPQPLAAGGAVAIHGRIYVSAGVGPGGLSNDTFVYNPSNRRWRKAEGPPAPREHLGIARAGGSVYLVGGRTHGVDTNMARADRYRLDTGKWRRIDDMPTARGGLAAAGVAGRLVVAAGGESRAGTFDEAEAYDVQTKEWSSLPDMPTARHGLAVVALGDTLYVICGGPQPGLTYSDANEAIDLGELVD